MCLAIGAMRNAGVLFRRAPMELSLCLTPPLLPVKISSLSSSAPSAKPLACLINRCSFTSTITALNRTVASLRLPSPALSNPLISKSVLPRTLPSFSVASNVSIPVAFVRWKLSSSLRRTWWSSERVQGKRTDLICKHSAAPLLRTKNISKQTLVCPSLQQFHSN